MNDDRKDWLMVVAVLVGGFIGFWVSFGPIFTYPDPLPAWVNPFVFAAIGAVIGFLIAKVILRRGERGD
jgi:hypothetical protein